MASFSDNFDRADSSNIGTDWAEDSGDVEITGNTLRQQTSGNVYRKTRLVGTAMDSDDYDSEVDGRASVSQMDLAHLEEGRYPAPLPIMRL